MTHRLLSDAQTDAQNVPLDGDSLPPRMAILLTYQCMQVPTWGTITLGQAPTLDQNSTQPSAASGLGFHELMLINQPAIL